MPRYTPNGALIEEGYYSDNPFDTGRSGERNAELFGGGKNTQTGWDYEARAPIGGATQGGNGEWYLGGGGGGGGGAPPSSADLFQMAIKSPWYQQALAGTEAAGAADSAARRAAIQQVLVQFGQVPGGFADKYGDIDDTTRNLATQNTSSGISAVARLKQALADTQRTGGRQLAAKGLRRSGARGYQMRRNQLGYDQSYSDAVNSLLGGVNKTYGDFAQGEFARSQSLAQALQAAIGNMSSWYTPRSGGSSGGRPPPYSGSQPAAAPTYYESAAGPSPYQPTSTGGVGGTQPGYYTGGALYATPTENPKISPNFWLK